MRGSVKAAAAALFAMQIIADEAKEHGACLDETPLASIIEDTNQVLAEAMSDQEHREIEKAGRELAIALGRWVKAKH